MVLNTRQGLSITLMMEPFFNINGYSEESYPDEEVANNDTEASNAHLTAKPLHQLAPAEQPMGLVSSYQTHPYTILKPLKQSMTPRSHQLF